MLSESLCPYFECHRDRHPTAFSERIKCFESYSFPIKMDLIVVGIVSQFTIQRKWVMAEMRRDARLSSRPLCR